MKNIARYIVVGVILAVLVISYFIYLQKNPATSKTKNETTQTSELDKVLTRDFVQNYPSTPREVVKWYNRILMLYYGEDLEEGELSQLAGQALQLFDDDLAANNPKEIYVASVKAEIQDYKDKGRKLVTADVADSEDVIYETVNGSEMAYIVAHYFVKENTSYADTYQKYALRKDEDGHWKILGYQLCDQYGDLLN
ncbi:MAG: hypothetical protein K6A05_03430 [Lachnospiraceae bacterium]|nr:hypothetical protein [Lachnospiraceae bacterium]